jgi:hypothetical protein
MKQLLFSILFFAAFFIACDKNLRDNGCSFEKHKTFTIDNGCAKISYKSRIGSDFDSALDSLIRQYEPELSMLATEGHYSGEGYDIDKRKINVDFNCDDREFFFLIFTEKKNVYRILYACDVIDENGNHFNYVSCPD